MVLDPGWLWFGPATHAGTTSAQSNGQEAETGVVTGSVRWIAFAFLLSPLLQSANSNTDEELCILARERQSWESATRRALEFGWMTDRMRERDAERIRFIPDRCDFRAWGQGCQQFAWYQI